MLEKRKYGLIGKNINYSFSKKYFNDKFLKENITNFFRYLKKKLIRLNN